MANRNDYNPYIRGQNSRYTGYGRPIYRRGRRRPSHGNAGIMVFAGVIAIACIVVGISLASRGHTAPPGSGSFTPLEPATAVVTGNPQTPQPTDYLPTESTTEPAVSASPENTETAAMTSEFFTSGDVQVDYENMTYKSANLFVKVTNINENGINYYIADCRAADSNRLFTAFATDKYAPHHEEKTSIIAQRKGAVIAVDGDYYGAAAADRADRGVVIRNGQLYRKTPWYDIAAVFGDGTMRTFDKSETTADQLIADGAVQAWNFGPMLLDANGKAIPTEKLKQRPPKYNPSNPRCGIGYIEPNHFVLIVVDGRGMAGSNGMTSTEFAQLFESLGCKCAYNLDGGGSATMVFMGRVINHPCDTNGERSVSDIIYFGESETDQANIDKINNR
jgi:exopolysaccharide biosynthesis protein